MKSLLTFSIFFVVAMPTFAMGENEGASVYENNRLDTLHFRDEKNQQELSIGATGTIRDTVQSTRLGQDTNYYLSRSTNVALTYSYGFSDSILGSLAINDLVSRTSDNTNQTNGVNTPTSASGLSDPTLGLNYRFHGGLKGTDFANISLNYSPSMGSNKAAAASATGNNMRGSVYAQLGVVYAHVMGKSEGNAAFYVQNYSDGSFVNSADSTNSFSAKSYTREYFAVNYRYHCSENQFLDIYGDLNLPYNISYQINSGYAYFIHYGEYFSPGLRWGMLIDEKSLLTLAYTFQSYSTQNNPTAGTNNFNLITSQVGYETLGLTYSRAF